MAEVIIVFATEKLLDLLNLNDGVNKDRFLQIYQPMFDNLSLIHNFYRKLFNKIINIMPKHFLTKQDFENYVKRSKLINHGAPILSEIEINDFLAWAIVRDFNEDGLATNTSLQKNDSPGYIASMDKVRDIFRNDRVDNLYQRVQIRQFATVCLRKIENKIELKFVWAVINYFINYKDSSIHGMNDNQYWTSDKIFEYLKDEKFDLVSRTNSPSEYLGHLLNTVSVPRIRFEVEQIQNELSKFYEEACMRFMELKYESFS